jgi:formate C-acetyltransferase
VNLKLAKRAFDAERRRSLLALVRTFMEKGGLELQINVVDRATLEDAAVHPERHGDLIVRIGGYSDYFTRLGPVLQREIIARTEC